MRFARFFRLMLACAALGGVAKSAGAQEAGGPPDPATIAMPDMTPSRDPDVISNGWKYFYFQKPDVTYAQAYADFSECYLFLPSYGLGQAGLPLFVPWWEPMAEGPSRPQLVSVMGVAGNIALGIVGGALTRRDRISRMRRCMETRGYVRYPLREEIWHQLVDDYSPRTIAIQALAASRPAPDLPQPTR